MARRKVSPNLTLPPSPHRSPRSPPASRQNSLRGNLIPEDQAQVDVELLKYQEDEEDWGLDFEREGAFGKLPNFWISSANDSVTKLTNTVTKATATLQLNKQNSRSWRSSGEEEEMDPFAGLEEEFEFVDDIEANLLRDKKATLCASVSGLVERVQSDRSALGDTCDELVSYTRPDRLRAEQSS